MAFKRLSLVDGVRTAEPSAGSQSADIKKLYKNGIHKGEEVCKASVQSICRTVSSANTEH